MVHPWAPIPSLVRSSLSMDLNLGRSKPTECKSRWSVCTASLPLSHVDSCQGRFHELSVATPLEAVGICSTPVSLVVGGKGSGVLLSSRVDCWTSWLPRELRNTASTAQWGPFSLLVRCDRGSLVPRQDAQTLWSIFP